MRFWKRRDPEEVEHAGYGAADIDRAYERGRNDERRRHRSHPILGFIVLAMALVGAGFIFLAAQQGSFSRGGAAVDHKLAHVADNADVAGQDAAVAASAAGENVQQAGQELRQNTLHH